MTFGHFLLVSWNWEPSVVVGCAALSGGYLAAVRFRPPRRGLCFGAGVLVLLLSLVSPLDSLGDTYLFSAHMLQHLLLELVVPPLLLLGIPQDLARTVLARPLLNRIERRLGQPVVAWLLGVATLWIWHLPALYNAALADERVHAFQHLCFLTTATIFWWPILSPLPERRLRPPATILYLAPAGVANSLLGILLAFAPRVLYPAYLHPADPQGILPVLRGEWGLTPSADQQLGGVLMWVLGGLVYIGFILIPLFRWLSEPEKSVAVGTEEASRP